MRLVFISTMTGYPWGGSEELWSQAAKKFADEGHQISAFTEQPLPFSDKFNALAAHKISLRARTGVRWGALLAAPRAACLRLGLKLRDENQQWLLEQRPDLVVISQGGNCDGFPWLSFCRDAGLPYVTIVQSNTENHWLPDDTAAQLAKVYQAAQKVFCVSRHNLRLLEQQIGEDLINAQIVWNPNNAAGFSLLPWPTVDGPTRLACVARLDPAAKGQDIIFQTLARPVWRERSVELNLFGDGPCKEILRRMVRRLGLENVRFHGHVPDIAEVWRHNHLLVLPSRHEGMPLSLIEAMSCGRPAVVTDAGGNPELCVDGEHGFVATAAIEPFGQALERAWAHRMEWRQIGQRARARIEQIIPANPVGEFCTLLTELVQERGYAALSQKSTR